MSRPPLEPLRLPLAQYPGFNPFVLEWLHGVPAAVALLPRGAAEQRCPGRPRGRDALVRALIDSNRSWGIDAAPALERWNAGDAVAIVAGQQVGFAGGPLYTVAKIASLLKMKREYEARGIAATVFFWLATEDHDYDEVATLLLAGEDGPRKLRARGVIANRRPVGALPVPETLISELLSALQIERPSWLATGATFGESFGRLLASVFGDGIVLVDSLLPQLRREGIELFLRTLDSWNDVQSVIAGRSAEITAAGYKPQVVPREGEGYSLLFHLDDDGEREPIHRNGGWRIGEREVSFSALVDLVRSQPERISTAALMRPLLQDLVLEPAVFVGGPAEVSYYAQIAPLHRMLGVAAPRVALRGHMLVAPSRILRAMQRYEIAPEQIFTPLETLLAEREADGVSELREAALRGHAALDAEIEKIAALVLPADKGLSRSIDRTIGHINYHFDKLLERGTRALVRRDQERFAALRALSATLHPEGAPQDRVASWLPFWLQYGERMIETMIAEMEPDGDSFKVVPL
jgi:bacillithiol biosynthesis cysteine-adding enzyme BshC